MIIEEEIKKLQSIHDKMIKKIEECGKKEEHEGKGFKAFESAARVVKIIAELKLKEAETLKKIERIV